MTEPNRRRWVLLLVTLLAATALAPPAAGVSATANETPNTTRVGENVSATFVLDDLYTGAPNAWQLHTATALENTTWTVTAYGLDDRALATRSFDGSALRTPVRASQNVSRIEVTVSGTVPAVGNFTYRPREQFTLAAFGRSNNGSQTSIRNWSAAHYTPESRSARRTLDATRTAIAENSSDDELEEQLGFAISAYRNGNFELATDIATDARTAANQPDYPVELLSGMFLGAVVTALGAAGFQSYRTREEDDPWRDR